MYQTSAGVARNPMSTYRSQRKTDAPLQEQGVPYAALPFGAVKKASVDMEDVRIRYSTTPPVQSKAFGTAVVQFAPHIHELQELEQDGLTIPVIPSEKPTMVFESMGTSNAAMENVYRQSRNYKGNTVCVFGLNKKRGVGGALVKDPDRSEIPHHLRNFSFEWSKPDRMDERRGYEMPFVEARRAIMEQANRLTLVPCNPDDVTAQQRQEVMTPAEEGRDLSWSSVYRWIDGDAGDDSSNDLDLRFLRPFATKEQAYVATGSYEWRHEADGTAAAAPNYHAFVALVNEKEAFLRESYMSCMHKEVRAGEGAGGAYAHGDFYLPESTFLMNWAAHNKMSNGRDGVDLDGDQARESMRLFNASFRERGKILYMKGLHVTKPLKREFIDGGYAESLIRFFTAERYSKPALAAALQNLRQSAFGNSWSPRDGAAKDAYVALKGQCIDEVGVFLTTGNKFALIQQEIGNLRGRRGRAGGRF